MDVGARDRLVHCVEILYFETLDFLDWSFASHRSGSEFGDLIVELIICWVDNFLRMKTGTDWLYIPERCMCIVHTVVMLASCVCCAYIVHVSLCLHCVKPLYCVPRPRDGTWFYRLCTRYHKHGFINAGKICTTVLFHFSSFGVH